MNGYPFNWSERRRKVLRRENYCCERCGVHDYHVPLEAHHMKDDNDNRSHAYEDLEALCIKCHYRDEHSGGDGLHGIPPVQALIRLMQRIDPHTFDTRRDILREMKRRLGYESLEGWEKDSLGDIPDNVSAVYGHIDAYLGNANYEPPYEFADTDVTKAEVEKYYFGRGKKPSIKELMNVFQISERDAALVVEGE